MVKPFSFHVLYSKRQPTSFPIFFNRNCLAIGIICVLLGYFGNLYGSYKCFQTVFWDENREETQSSVIEVLGETQRHKAMAFVGIYTGFSSVGRREALRKTWMPSDQDGLKRLEETTGLAFRFVIGRSSNSSKKAALGKEIQKYGDFLLLDIEDNYNNLCLKTIIFFKEAFRLYDCSFYVKIDDDIYLRPDRLSLLLGKKRSNPRNYIGCMKNGYVYKDPNHKWYEPNFHLLASEYYLYAFGSIYVLSSDIVSRLVSFKNDRFRMFGGNEDVMIGSWMLAMDVDHEHENELCQTQCTTSSIAIWDMIMCSGLCHPEQQLIQLHKMDICSNSSTMHEL
ncbi:Beta-1,3-GlcNAc transferase, family GT31 [Zostera marina]|uniref:Hexosyltransferase n=1 Tax=Zostera marina TaxID=29655 RepID=A0A0K9PQ88_ZOSMR|nr:Beta-1,3-GlcNAc transferase, family GT31 [Zostera marina]